MTKAVFLPYQQAWAADTSPVKLMEKSRRVGMSWSEAGDATLTAASTSGMDVWYIGYNKEMAEEFIGDCADWVERFGYIADEVEEEIVKDDDKDILTYKIRFASGHRITALSSRPSNLRGKQGRVIIDEAAFHDDLKELIKAAIALLMWGGQVHIISTHDGDTNYFNTLIDEIRAGKKPYSIHRVTLDDALEQGLYQRICSVKGLKWSKKAEIDWRQDLIDFYGDAADEELFCIPSAGGGTYLTRMLIKQCMSESIPVVRYEQTPEFTYKSEYERQSAVEAFCEEQLKPLLDKLDPNRISVFGQDFARNGDLSAIIPLQEQQDTSWTAPFVLEMRCLPFEQQKQILFYIVDNLPKFHHGSLDARGNGQWLAEVAAQKYGQHRISQVMLSEKWYRENMPKYKAAFEDKAILLPNDADIIEDHRAFKMIKGVARLPEGKTNSGSDKKNQRHGDTGIAGALAVHATEQDGGGETVYESIAKRLYDRRKGGL